ncbi:hypothetical protein MKX01_001827 [Papaver californicum]|nr:hypothetical protein MKX01_001827 [Papaver californicum]
MDSSTKPAAPPQPQISEMFSKFALALKTKTVEFFAEDEEYEEESDYDGVIPSLLDSPEEVITGQRVVVIKPDYIPIPKHIQQNCISSLFATISSFEASYLQLQTAHSPFDSGNIKIADKSLVSHLQKCSEIKHNYRDYVKSPRLTPPKLPFGSQYEAQVNENQSILRTLGLLVDRLQCEIDLKDCQVSSMKQKLDQIEKENSLLKAKSSSKSAAAAGGGEDEEVLVSINLFDSVLRDACKSTHRFCKHLIDLVEKVGWDLKLAANSVYPNVEYAKNGHT